MDHTAGHASQVTVARYDDDYPLLFGEPARQPQWPAARKVVHLPQQTSTRRGKACESNCRSCGACQR
jgi:hypothetical protein